MPNTEPNKEITPKRKRGRPEGFKEEYCNLLIDYFKARQNPYKEVFNEITGKSFTKKEVKLLPSELPTLEGFCNENDLYPEIISNWRQRHASFSKALMRAKSIQKNSLVQGAIAGVYDSKFSQFLACNITDYKAPALLNIEPGGINITLQKFSPSESLTEKVDIKPIKSKPILQIPEKIKE